MAIRQMSIVEKGRRCPFCNNCSYLPDHYPAVKCAAQRLLPRVPSNPSFPWYVAN
uniref:Uncharacterized protein n=1 Tax=Pyxicephalus adspersus TaxID=30357 RepID=A0A499QZ47_PYXAD|nr:hypothetical protein maker-92A13-exonerate_protein2genome-gene-0.19 [Pyxicephalus adspersus]